MEQYEWENWVDSMKDNHGVRIPDEIEFRSANDDETWTRRSLRDATLDELSSAIVALDEQIEHLTSVRVGLTETQKRARRSVRPGSMSVQNALFPKQSTTASKVLRVIGGSEPE